MKEKSNVDRLVKAGVLDAKNLKKAGSDAINGIDLTDEEIEVLKRIKRKLKLEPLILEGPEKPFSQPIQAWHL
jgi:hypothetical protein